MKIPIKKLHKDTKIPKMANAGDAGRDAYIVGFRIPTVEGEKKTLIDVQGDTYVLKPLARVGCRLGFATAIPDGYFFQVVPRSGLALWDGLSLLNTPGTIDAGYRNEWMAIIANLSNKDVTLKKGDRICQIILAKLQKYDFEEVVELPTSERGQGGFGSTGKI
ncbi:MAG: deoxyuridine 5'-triphosphate nucleotidohydrolase Dut [Promethearchaeota archaeon CR_4]|nr:MAG: deoxyuridine 5'-triphosphate nucleotidohydrolase Dut [Candidatus Lokiarchaeota archaeon CR_4]